MSIAVNDGAHSVLARVISWIARSWESAGEAEMIAAMDDQTIREIAHDCGITPEQLIELAKAGPHAADEMIEMMRALSIDPTEVELRFRNQFRVHADQLLALRPQRANAGRILESGARQSTSSITAQMPMN